MGVVVEVLAWSKAEVRLDEHQPATGTQDAVRSVQQADRRLPFKVLEEVRGKDHVEASILEAAQV